jgi:alpha-1,6-mannosyltransferase
VKVCDLTQFYSPVSGGVRRYLERKVAYMRAQLPGSSHLLIVPGETTGVSGDEHARVYTIASPLVSRTSRYRILLKLHLVEEILESERPDLIESGDPYQLAWKAVASGDGLGIPTVAFYHSHFPEALLRSVSKFSGRVAQSIAADAARRYVKALYNRFATTFVPGPALAAELAAWGVEGIECVDLGVDVAVFRPGDDAPTVRSRLGLPRDGRFLLYVGRLAPEKNVGVLFDAFRILARQGRGYRLVVVGDGTLRHALERLALETGTVQWLRFCSEPHQLAEIYRAADLFVHPGIQETFGLVTLESQACGTPVVGIRGSYMDRIVFCDQIRWADRNTPESLAHAIAAQFEGDLRQVGLDASQKVRSQFSWERAFERIFDVYRKVIADARR